MIDEDLGLRDQMIKEVFEHHQGNIHVYDDVVAWLKHREKGIGASSVPTLFEFNRFDSPYALWARMTGKADPIESTLPMRIGHALEETCAKEFHKKTEIKTWDPGDFTIFHDPELPILSCTPDRLIEDPFAVVELKTTFDFEEMKLWKDSGAPLSHQAQIQAQMGILGCETGYLAGLLGNRELIVVPVVRNDDFVSMIHEKVSAFMECVTTDTPPVVDGSEATYRILKELHPDDNSEPVIFGADAIAAIANLKDAKENLKDLKETVQGYQNIVLDAFGDFAIAQNDEGKDLATYKRHNVKGKHTVHYDDEEDLIAAHIDYETTAPRTQRTLRLKK